MLGTIGFDENGDVTGYDTFAWYIWKDGEYAPVDPADLLSDQRARNVGRALAGQGSARASG